MVFVLSVDKNNKNDVEKSTRRVRKEAGTASLGTIAKLTAKLQSLRAERFNLLKKIRSILLREGSLLELSPPTKFHRTSLCKHAVTGQAGVGVNKLKKAKKAFYTGLQTCGSVWTCPVCSNKIQELRRIEIAHAMRYFNKNNKQAVMITFTFPHTKSQKLNDILNRFKEALDKMRANGSWRRYFKSIGYEGLITSTEIMYGQNGWHPHTHELHFIDVDVDEKALIDFVKNQWKLACISQGLLQNNENKIKDFLTYSVDIHFNCKTSDYLAKFDAKENWGIDREIAKASTKKGKSAGKHPFQLADENNQELFIEYVKAIKGRHQLRWSRFLKKRIGIKEITDEEAAQREGDDEVELIGIISKKDWFEVLDKDLRTDILDFVENNKKVDIQKIRSFILCSETKQNE